MPVTILERYDSRETNEDADNPSVDLLYVVQGSENDTDVRTIVEATAPATFQGLKFQSYHLNHVGNGVWEVAARYGKTDPVQSTFSFETGGGSQHITQSLATIARYAPAGFTPPDFQGAIGVDGDSVAGVDIQVPIYSFTETHHISDALVTGAYKLTLFQLTGRVNNAGFKGFAKGEVLFLGASGSKSGVDDWEITFRFSASPNVTGLSIGSITGIAKEGWQYLWIRFDEDEDSIAKTLIKRPSSVHIEQVYRYGDFSGLGIGV